MGEAKKTLDEEITGLEQWLKELAWRWNKGMERADDVRSALLGMGETYEEVLGAEIELATEEKDDQTGFRLELRLSTGKRRIVVGPVEFNYIPGATEEQVKRYAEARRRAEEA